MRQLRTVCGVQGVPTDAQYIPEHSRGRHPGCALVHAAAAGAEPARPPSCVPGLTLSDVARRTRGYEDQFLALFRPAAWGLTGVTGVTGRPLRVQVTLWGFAGAYYILYRDEQNTTKFDSPWCAPNMATPVASPNA